MNRPILAATLVPLLMLPAYPQSPSASLQGLVSYPGGSPVPNAPIQVKHQTNGTVARTRSDANGHYKFSALADGKWDFTIRMPCCAYNAVASEVVVVPDKTQQVDVKLVENLNGSTLGDDPARNAEAMRKRQRVPSKPVPHAAAGVPDLSGVWLLRDDPYPEVPELLPVTFEDPQAFAKPYHENLTMTLAPQEELIEFVCENNKPEHLVPSP